MNARIRTVLRALEFNNFKAEFVESSEIAKKKIYGMIPQGAVVGVGDSATIRQIKIVDELKSKGTTVIDPFSEEIARKIAAGTINREKFKSLLKNSVTSDVFLTGTNAVTLDGKLVNIDGAGNRTAGTIFGPERVIIVVGKNKIVKNVNEALYRTKELIAPVHAKTKNYDLPCTRAGKCVNCNSKLRICCITTIIERAPRLSDLLVMIVGEDLGLSWSRSWPHERISEILTKYSQVTYLKRAPWWPLK